MSIDREDLSLFCILIKDQIRSGSYLANLLGDKL